MPAFFGKKKLWITFAYQKHLKYFSPEYMSKLFSKVDKFMSYGSGSEALLQTWLFFDVFGGAGGFKDGATLLGALAVANLQQK